MKEKVLITILSLFLAFLTVLILTKIESEFAHLLLFVGFMLNWVTEQLMIEILREPYFTLDNVSAFLNLKIFGELGEKFISFTAKNLSTLFNLVFYSIIYLSTIFSISIFKKSRTLF